MITTDQYSKYPNISNTGTTNTKQVIDATVELITYFSIPEIIYSDGGPQFWQEGAFDVFCKEWGIKQVLVKYEKMGLCLYIKEKKKQPKKKGKGRNRNKRKSEK